MPERAGREANAAVALKVAEPKTSSPAGLAPGPLTPRSLAALQRTAGNAAVSRLLARQPQTAEEEPATEKKDRFKGTLVNSMTVSLARGRVGFSTPLGMILGNISTDLKPGRYKLRPDFAQKRWVITEPAVFEGQRFDVTLEGADPWTMRYPAVVPLFVAVGSTEEPETYGDMLDGDNEMVDPLWLYEGWPEDARPKPIEGIDDFESVYYDLDYRSERGNLSKWLRVRYRDGSLKEINLDTITEKTPKLWAAKQDALKIMDDYNALFILGTFPTVFFLITMAPTAEPVAPNALPRVQRRALSKPSRQKVDPEEGKPVEMPSTGKTEAKGTPTATQKVTDAEAFTAATTARDQMVAQVKTLPKSKREPIATVTAGTNVETGETVAAWNQGGMCAEDVVVSKLGGDASKIRFSKATRPRTDKEVPVCERCQGKYTQGQFPEGTKFQGQ